MNWSNVKLIFLREVRDQLRDRRTLFTIAVLPLLLYPLLGMIWVQISHFMNERPDTIWVVGSEHLPEDPPLLDGELGGELGGESFHSDLCSADESRLMILDTAREVPEDVTAEGFSEYARELIQRGDYAAVIRFPDGFSEALGQFRNEDRRSEESEAAVAMPTLPTPELIYDAAHDKSGVTNRRIRRVLATWQRSIVRQYLTDRNISPNVTDPFHIKDVDVSVESSRRAAFWSKMLPFVVFIWALTGAFYPAVDLCAGEKERGTLETLLSSPAERSEIVLGKLLTIMGFSSATAMLNLVSMAITGTAVIVLQPGLFPIGAPPPLAMVWLFLALIPVSALFSALALAIAAFARSTKEGQYYLMPLLLISLPLMTLPLLPAVQLELGTSLVPITGMMLLLRALVEGRFAEAAIYAPPVLLTTAACCFLAIRWAVDQFNNESVLFRESERTDIRLWIRHMFRERGPTPTVAQAIACAVVLLTIRFYATTAAKMPTSWTEFATMQFMTLALLIAVPVLVMTAFLTRNPRATLLLNRSSGKVIGMSVLLAVTIHPVAMLVAEGVMKLYPINETMTAQYMELQKLVASAPSLWYIIGLMALTPAVCEELAFRGFILSGLRHMGSKWRAIVISSVLFGLAHGILQQSITASLVGMVLGFIAVQTGSLLPCIGFHFVYNSLGLLASFGFASVVRATPALGWFFSVQGESVTYDWPLVVIGTALAVLILNWFRRLPYEVTAEEELREALSHQSAGAAAS